MSITNYGELKAAVADYAKRRDLAAQIPDFIRAAHLTLQEHVGVLAPLSADTDTNKLLEYDPFTYLFGALAELAVYVRDEGPLAAYALKFQAKLSNLDLTGFDILQSTPSGGHHCGACLP